MKKGEVYEGIIEQVDFPNKGRVMVDGQPVIVKNGMPGQRVRFMINKKRGGRVEARLLEVLEPSPLETRKPVCSIFPQCGGCMYQTMDYSHQLEMKQEQIRRLLDTAIKNGGQVDKTETQTMFLRESREALQNSVTVIRWNFRSEMPKKTVR